jgi:hypothetical protein
MLLPSGVVLAAVAGFILVYVHPFEAPPSPSSEAIAAAWNESIHRLGIFPVYPPQEDFEVGDLLAVIVGAESTTLLGKSVRVARIDMRDLIVKEQQDRLLFADTIAPKDGDPIRRHDRLAVAAPAPDRVALALAAFPGFVVRHSINASGSAGASRWRLTGAREDQEMEEIRISVAETYGVSSASAAERLEDWCSRKESQRRCTAGFARRTLQFAFGEPALAARDGIQPTVELVLVTRVYLTREIEQRRSSSSNRNAAADAPLDVAGPHRSS